MFLLTMLLSGFTGYVCAMPMLWVFSCLYLYLANFARNMDRILVPMLCTCGWPCVMHCTDKRAAFLSGAFSEPWDDEDIESDEDVESDEEEDDESDEEEDVDVDEEEDVDVDDESKGLQEKPSRNDLEEWEQVTNH